MDIIQPRRIFQSSELVDLGGVYEFYADDIACVQDRGDNFRTVFIIWEEQFDRGSVVMVPRIIGKITRPKSSILRGQSGAIAEMLALDRKRRLPILHS